MCIVCQPVAFFRRSNRRISDLVDKFWGFLASDLAFGSAQKCVGWIKTALQCHHGYQRSLSYESETNLHFTKYSGAASKLSPTKICRQMTDRWSEPDICNCLPDSGRFENSNSVCWVGDEIFVFLHKTCFLTRRWWTTMGHKVCLGQPVRLK